MTNRGILVEAFMPSSGYAFLKVTQEGCKKVQEFYFSGWDEECQATYPTGGCYVFESKPGCGKNKPSIIKDTWTFALVEDQFLLGAEQQAPELYRVWSDQLHKIPSDKRLAIYRELAKGSAGTLKKAMGTKKYDPKLCIKDAKLLYAEIKKCKALLDDKLFNDVVKACAKIRKWLCWNVKTNTTSNLATTNERWEKLLGNPYHIAYGLGEGDGKLLRQIKSAETSKLDKIFLNHDKVKPEEDVRVEYWIFDSINHGQGPLKNRATCYTSDEIVRKMNDRKREKEEEEYTCLGLVNLR